MPVRLGDGYTHLNVGELSTDELTRRLRGDGLRLRNGPAVVCVKSQLNEVRHGIALHYGRHEVPDDDRFTELLISGALE